VKVCVRSFGVSLDGFSAGPHQDLQHPLGVNGPELTDWFLHTRVWREMHGAGDRDARIGGGVSTVRQYLEARLVDELQIAVRPVLLGQGEPLFAGLDLRALGYVCERTVAGERATHVFIRKRD
jgi:dihydrofolate reductase